MKEILPNIFAVDIPKDAWSVKMMGEGGSLYYNSNSLPGSISARITQLKNGPYTLLFCSKDVTEEQGRGILAKYGLSCNIHSILKSHSLLSNNYAIITNRA